MVQAKNIRSRPWYIPSRIVAEQILKLGIARVRLLYGRRKMGSTITVAKYIDKVYSNQLQHS
jgi:hypothetical protein